MEQTIELNGSGIMAILVTTALIVGLMALCYRVLKECIQYTTYNGWNVLSPVVIILWGAPAVIPFLLYYYSNFNKSTLPIWLIPAVSAVCGIFLLKLIIGTIKLMGVKYGVLVVAIRLLFSLPIGIFTLYMGFIALALFVLPVIVYGGIISRAVIILHGPEKDIIIHKTDSGTLIDNKGNLYFLQDDGSLISGELLYVKTGGGAYMRSDGTLFYSYKK